VRLLKALEQKYIRLQSSKYQKSKTPIMSHGEISKHKKVRRLQTAHTKIGIPGGHSNEFMELLKRVKKRNAEFQRLAERAIRCRRSEGPKKSIISKRILTHGKNLRAM
jgi:ribosome maturation protein Sdo1